MARSVLPFLMFQGQATAAIELYTSLFPDAIVSDVVPKADGTIERATVTLAGQSVRVYDSPPIHQFTFTPSWSFFVECDDEDEQSRLFGTLSEGGGVLMPLDDYGFSRHFGWLNDRFGVSWQLNLTEPG